jgi:nucleotide-binding universal stress UspA family protein
MTQTRSGTVVVGVDGSRASVAALILALREAHEQHQAVEVVTVWAAPAGAGDGGLFMARAARRRALRVQTLATTRAVRLAGCHVPITGVLLDGDPGDILVEASGDAARLVLGSSRTRACDGAPAGSVVRRCLTEATCPVLVVPEDTFEEPHHPETSGHTPGHAYRGGLTHVGT